MTTNAKPPGQINTITKTTLHERATEALNEQSLQQALSVIGTGFVEKRQKAMANFPEFNASSNRAVEIKNHTLDHLTHYLTTFEQALEKAGGTLHFASTPDDARSIITKIARQVGAKSIAKGKTMVGEEIHLTQHLESEGFDCVETDLGEYLIQLRSEMPSHIIAPAVHLTREKIRSDFEKAHKHIVRDHPLETPSDFVKEARQVLREKFNNADMGITGANILVAETGSIIIVTNEGNGDLCASLPKTHIVISSFEKLVPTFEDASVILRLLARSATGQPISTYTTLVTGQRPEADKDGPVNMHVVLLDNGRSQMLGSNLQEMLRCIRCGACLNHCPVYQNLGGHAYGSVYPGPMGSVLSPQFFGQQSIELPFASSFCGRCNEVCPMQIPLINLMRDWRFEAAKTASWQERLTMKLWARLARSPALYNKAMRLILPIANWMIKQRSLGDKLPLLKKWAKHRTLPEVRASSFQTQYARRKSTQNNG